uniref:Uncharacterized protein n=1 Tax=Tetraselmis sp. GSL018 TaxID=582737 RepID=A0A061QX97_9CHLO
MRLSLFLLSSPSIEFQRHTSKTSRGDDFKEGSALLFHLQGGNIVRLGYKKLAELRCKAQFVNSAWNSGSRIPVRCSTPIASHS